MGRTHDKSRRTFTEAHWPSHRQTTGLPFGGAILYTVYSQLEVIFMLAFYLQVMEIKRELGGQGLDRCVGAAGDLPVQRL